MPNIYDYTLYRTDGSIQALAPQEAMHPEDIEETIAGYMAIIPQDIYRHKNLGSLKDITVYGINSDDAMELDPNPHFTELNGSVLVEKLHRVTQEAQHDVKETE